MLQHTPSAQNPDWHCVARVHVSPFVRLSRYGYALPESVPLSSSKSAPTSAVSSLIDTAVPKSSLAAPSLAVILVFCDQTAETRTKRYTLPESLPWSSSLGEPMMAVSFLIPTALPKSSPTAGSLGWSFA